MSLDPVEIGSLTLTPAGSDPQHVRAVSDLNIESDSDASGAGDLIFKTGGVERARISAAGVGTGWPALLGGSQTRVTDARLQWLGTSIARTMTAGLESLGIAVLSDSTGNENSEYPYLLGQALAAAFPAYGVEWYLFSDATQDYGVPTQIQAPPLGEAGIVFNGSTDSWQIPAAAITQPTDLDIAVKVNMTDWTPAAIQTLAAKFQGAGQRTFRFQVDTLGKLELNYSSDGTALVTDVSTVATGFTDGTTHWVRVTLDVDDGAGNRVTKFYTSSDGVTWTQLGSTVTTAGAITLFNATTAAWEVGARGGSAERLIGTIYRCHLRNNILGPHLLPIYIDSWQPSSTNSPTTTTGSPMLAIVAGCVSGQGLTYLSDATRLPKLLPRYALRAVILATSHNDNYQRDFDWSATWATWITNVKTYAPQATPAISSQNPRISPATQITDHARRRNLLSELSVRLAVPFFDAYQAFVNLGDYSSYIKVDGIHPTNNLGDASSGESVWANYLYAALFGP